MIKLVLWGTGGRARETFGRLLSDNYQVVAFIDSDASRHGEFMGRKVFGPEALRDLDYEYIYIASAFHDEICRTIEKLGIERKCVLPPDSIDFLLQTHRLTARQLRALADVPFWYHRFEILPGVMTPGICNYKPYLLDHPELQDATGKKVLDIGAWDGPYTREMTRRGAQATGFDIQPPNHSGFNTMCALNAIEPEHFCENVYNLSPEAHGLYDVVLFFGVFYHLKNPLLAFENINRVLRIGGLMAFEGAILEGAPSIDAFWRDNSHVLEFIKNTPLAYYSKGSYQGEWSNWWVPNLTCLKQWIESCGFEIIRSGTQENDTRGMGLARKVADIPLEHIVLPSPGGK